MPWCNLLWPQGLFWSNYARKSGGLFRPESTRTNVSALEVLFCSRFYPSLLVSQQNPIWISNVIAETYQAENVLNEVNSTLPLEEIHRWNYGYYGNARRKLRQSQKIVCGPTKYIHNTKKRNTIIKTSY